MKKESKVNVYQLVTDRIIAELEKGVIPWHKPWTGTPEGAFNRISKRPYSILNQMILKHTGEYATFKQWSDLGGHIRKGEKSEIVVFWKVLPVETENKDGEKEIKNIPFLRYYNVFHISQVDGVEPLPEKPFQDVEPFGEADKLMSDYVLREGIDFQEKASDRAFYNPIGDYVVVPQKEQYKHINEYYSTVFHELTHSTGHKTRLDRLKSTAFFGDDDYSKEELVAEIGSATLMNMLGIETIKTFRNSTAYIQSWLKVLQNDNKFIVSAASQADKAVNFITGVV